MTTTEPGLSAGWQVVDKGLSLELSRMSEEEILASARIAMELDDAERVAQYHSELRRRELLAEGQSIIASMPQTDN